MSSGRAISSRTRQRVDGLRPKIVRNIVAETNERAGPPVSHHVPEAEACVGDKFRPDTMRLRGELPLPVVLDIDRRFGIELVPPAFWHDPAPNRMPPGLRLRGERLRTNESKVHFETIVNGNRALFALPLQNHPKIKPPRVR